jgi:methanogenic corrinoid protein MtbC1
MRPIDRQLADTLDGVSRALAEWSVGLLYERHPGFEARYGAQGRALWKGEMLNRIQHLSEAIAADRPALFTNSVEWAQAAFLARDMDPIDLVEALGALEETIRAELPAQVAARASRLLEEGLAVAKRRPTTDAGVSACAVEARGADTARARAYLQHLMERHQSKAVDVLLEAVGTGRSVGEVYETVIAPALAEVGRLWHMREATVADEHYVTAATQSAMAILRTRLPSPTPNGRRALAASVGGDQHDIGIRMVADLLESEGWQVDCLGANMPTSDLVEHTFDEEGTPQFHLVALSASTALAVRATASAIEALRAATRDGHLPVIVGGGPFTLVPDLWQVVGADGCAKSAVDAARVAGRVVRGG